MHRFTHIRWMAFSILLWVGGRAMAWPVDEIIDVKEGDHRFQKLLAASWAEAEDPKIGGTAIFPNSGEVLVEGKMAGRTLVMAYSQGRLAVWQLRVGLPNKVAEGPIRSERLKAARQACPTLQETPGAEVTLKVRVPDNGCRRALLELFQADAQVAKELELTFEMTVLQAQLADIEHAFAERKLTGLSVKYLGAGLILSGTVSEADHRKALLEIFRHSVGRVALEDRVESP